MGVGACVLGYADDEVDESVIRAVRNGVTSTLNVPEEVELAKTLIDLHPWFDMVRFARGGGEAMSIAIRIARAHTNRDKVLFSGYHGWNDWYLAANLNSDKNLDGHLMAGLEPRGVPRGLLNSSIPFDVNSIESIRTKIKKREKEIAAIVIEPARGEDAPIEYLQNLRSLATEIGAVLIFDEITSGFRMCAGGIHRIYKVNPDIAVFAKSMANGYAMSAVLGKATVMQSAQKTFISSTNWTERIGPVAALATIKKYKRENVEKHIISIGNKVKEIWLKKAVEQGIAIKVTGLPSLAAFEFNSTHAIEMNTVFTIEMLKRGFLAFRQFKPSLAHDEGVLQKYSKAVEETFIVIKNDPSVASLITPKHHTGFQRLTKE
jgi:glutamate-1-semialdehyde aminotransferase